MQRIDLLVVGAGSAGLVAARTAAGLGARVTLVERGRPGGDCLWTGCVPSKAFLAAAAAAHAARSSERFGVHADVRVDLDAVLAHVRRAQDRIAPVDSVEALRADGVDVRTGTARFTGPGRAEVDGVALRFRRAVLATGADPVVPDLPGLAGALTSDTVWGHAGPLRSLVVLGAGPVGCELAQGFARLGTAVTLVEANDRVLPGEDPDASARLGAALRRDGVDLRLGTPVTAVDGGDVVLDDGTRLPADRVLVALGRRPAVAGLGLDALGVALDDTGHVAVDDRLRTSAPGVFAAGDVVGAVPPGGAAPFTHVAGVHGSVAATNALLAPLRRVHHAAYPRVTYTEPEVAHVGLTAAEAGPGARERVLEHAHVDRAVAEDATEGVTRVVLDARGRVLGATIVAPRAAEMLTELTALVARRGRLRDLAGVVHPYPGWGDGVWNAALAELGDSLSTPMTRLLARTVVRARRLGRP
ncbi:dihydrolipoyl dehydrogenase family protein [Actinomycetospora atypica]|uniref:Dihydrolipoyl dehydrogenase family protein n=1 Tax=Actinomycetospora atypica TaxID=1290095 RepID=A0ABV9YIA8_9PSEU